MTRLHPRIEEAIRALEDADDEDDRIFMTEMAPLLPGIPKPPMMRARELLEPERLAYLLPEPKRKPRNPNWKRQEWNVLDDIAEDARRLERMGLPPAYARAGAAEMHLRLVHGYCTIDRDYRCGGNGLIWVDEDELANVIDELQRWTGRRTSGAERRRKAKSQSRSRSARDRDVSLDGDQSGGL